MNDANKPDERIYDKLRAGLSTEHITCHGLDTPECIYFYEHEYYVLSNFSAFRVNWAGIDFDTSEHAYQWDKFHYGSRENQAILDLIKDVIAAARSAHEAYQIAQAFKQWRHPEWDNIKLKRMKHILQCKVSQHEYVKRKLLQSGNRTLVENSFRDDFWGTGPDENGKNWLGKLWMEVRLEEQNKIAKEGA